MKARPLRSYAGRFLLPLALLGAAAVVWLIANQGSGVARAQASNQGTAVVDAPLASIRRLPELASTAFRVDTIASALAALPIDPGGLSCASVLVDGTPILDVRSELPLAPGYAQLFITGHAAIDVLGPNFRYETRAMANSLPNDEGNVSGGLYLIGGGDPVLMSRSYAASFRPTLATRTPIEELAAAIAQAGVVRIDGGIIGVDRRYDDQRSLPGWPYQFALDGLVGPLTALQLDDAFEVRPSTNGGVAVPSGTPTVFTAEQFVADLELAGVQAFGLHRALFPDEVVPGLVPIATITSAPLNEIILQMWAVNDASAAEMILKELGVADEGEGSTQAGARVIQKVLQQQGVDVPVPFRDGSGLDPIGATSCTQLAQTADTITDGHPTLSAMPGYTLPGVFDGEFRDLSLDSDLRLIGGVVGDARGFVARTIDDQADITAGRARVTVASIVNRPGGPNAQDRAYQRALVEMVDELRMSITVVDLALDD